MTVPAFLKQVIHGVSKHRERILLLLGMALVGGLSFEAGMLRGALYGGGPAVLSVPVQAVVEAVQGTPVTQAVAGAKVDIGGAGTSSGTNCAFVGSRNSDKYHLPKCSAAKRIKPENLVCFASKEDAEKRGYVAGCLK